jgi:hypothetical protein
MHGNDSCSAFQGGRLLASGPRAAVASAVRVASAASPEAPILIFDDASGAGIDLDLRDTAHPAVESGEVSSARGRGRPKLGVIAREVTLLPQHWDWLAAQPGGASVTLRKLVHAARSAEAPGGNAAARHAASYRFMSAMAGNLPGFEEAARALFSARYQDFEKQMSRWPQDVRRYALTLARGNASAEPDR